MLCRVDSKCDERTYPFPFTLVDEEKTPTAPLSNESEETGFLHDVERARSVMASKPEITSQELNEALGLKSAIYAHTVKVYVNAQKSAEEGPSDAFTN